MWGKDTEDFLDYAGTNVAKDTNAAGFGANFDAAVKNEIASGLSISKYIMQSPIRERNAKIKDMVNSDNELAQFRSVTIDPQTGYPKSTIDFDSAADYLVQRGDEGFQSTAELGEQIQVSVKQADEYQKAMSKDAGFAGTAGALAGTFATQVAEPVNYVAVLPGLGQATLTAKMVVGAAEAAVATSLVVPTIKEWKNENDVDYTTKDAILDIGMSAAFGGTLSGLTAWIKGLRKGTQANKKNASADEIEAMDAADQRIADLEQEVVAAQALPEELRPETAGKIVDAIDDRAKMMAKAEDKWVEPENPSILSDSELSTIEAMETSLGIRREKVEGAEGVDADTLDKIVVDDESVFGFEVEGKSAMDVIKNSDAEINKLDETFTCMMGGGNG